MTYVSVDNFLIYLIYPVLNCHGHLKEVSFETINCKNLLHKLHYLKRANRDKEAKAVAFYCCCVLVVYSVSILLFITGF